MSSEIDLRQESKTEIKLPRGVVAMELNGRIMFVRRTAGGMRPVSDEEAIAIVEKLKRDG